MDVINIKNLAVYGKHGVLEAEKQYRQRFDVSASLYLDLRCAGKADDLNETVDYAEVCLAIKSFIEDNSFDLIETVAEGLAEKLLIENPGMQRVWLEVSKPEARINAEFETVSVEVERGRHTAYIALGTNMGDREAYLGLALEEIENAHGCSVVSVSSFINTTPYGVVEQDDFLNACAEVETLLTPHELLSLLQEIENKAGRERSVKWGPRTLDLDILLYDDDIISDSVLRVPHPEMHKRGFVLLSLCEIAPYKIHPVLMKTAEDLLDSLGDKS